jgi:short-subunit dehydrogenase
MSNFTEESTATEVAATLATHITGKVVLVTGCSPNGLGATAAMAIASHHPSLIILAGTNRLLTEQTERTLLEKTPSLKTRILVFDLGSLKSVRDATTEVNNYPEKIDALINNAGIMISP